MDQALKAALREDLGVGGDVSSKATIPAGAMAQARLVARQAGVAAGLDLFARAFFLVDRRCRVRLTKKDGTHFKAGALLASLRGPARSLLAAERVALNFAQRLSGVATLTAKFVAAARGTGASILDTRKTTPGLRIFEKHAVLCGGGKNHRMGLYDAVLIKDNHIRLCGSPSEAVRRARAYTHGKAIEVEVDTLSQLRDALEAGPDIVLLDNMNLATMQRAVAIVAKRRKHVLTEISGGVRLEAVRRIARLGVDRISVGALTHSAPAVDLSLEFL
jgi:nicotinate-nucleotide pyrophosphorylase (carboxylating)